MSTAIVRTAEGDLDALVVDVTIPRVGVWLAHATLREASAATGAASLVLTGPSGAEQVFAGTIRRSGRWAGAAEVQMVIVGGAGALAGTIGPLDHAAPAGVPASLVVEKIAEEAGETLATGVLDELAGYLVARWTRVEGTGLEALGLLADELGLAFRVLDSGEVWMGAEAWPDVDSATVLGDEPMAEDHDDGRFESRPDEAILRPGVVLRDRRVERVTYRCSSAAFELEALYQVEGEARRELAPRLYRETHVARVVAQNDDDSLELDLSDPRLPGMSAVPFRCGIPGARLSIPSGSIVRVAFEGGSPAGAFAFALSQDPTAAKGVVRVGDAGIAGTLTGSTPAGPVTFTYTPPSGAPPPPGLSVALVTKATEGSSEVKIR